MLTDPPLPDCPACGAPVEHCWHPDASCPTCHTPLRASAEAAQAAINALTIFIQDSPALPGRLQASLKAKIFEANAALQTALNLGLQAAPSEAVTKPVVDAAAAPVVETAVEPVVENIGETHPDPIAAEPTTKAPAEVAAQAEAPVRVVKIPPTTIEPAVSPATASAPALDATPPAEAFGGAAAAKNTAAARKTPARREPPSAPTLWQRLGPAFAENLLFFLGGFLLLAGAVYFVSTAWTTMTGTSQLLVIEGGILSFGALLVGAGHLLNRDGNLDDLDAVLDTAGAACTAFAALAVGRLLHTDGLSGAGGIALWLAGGFGINTWALRRLRLPDRRIAGAILFAALGAVIAPIWTGWPVALAAVGTGVGVWMTARQIRWPIATLALIGASVSAVQVALHTGAWGVLALPLAGAAWAYSRPARTLSEAHDLAAVGLTIAAVVLGLLSPNAALLCAATGSIVAGRAAVHRDNRGLLIAALVLGLVAYVLLPAPIRGIVLALKAKAAAGLGYAGGRLPLAWYGVTCLPYVALCGWVARRLASERPQLARWTRGWVLGIAAALCLLAFTTVDLRAPLLVLPAEGLLLLGLAFWLGAPRMAQAAPALLAAAPVLAMLHFDWPFASATLGITALVLTLRLCLPREGVAVHGVYQTSMWLLFAAALLTALPAVWTEQRVHWLDLLVSPLLVVATWPMQRLRPLALLGLHRMVPATAALTGAWTWPVAFAIAALATLGARGHQRDRLQPLSGWALLAVAILSGAYALPFGIDATIGLLGASLLGVVLAWGTGHSPLAAVGLLCFAGAAATVAWIFELRASRIGMCAALALSLGIVGLGWLHRTRRAIYDRIGHAPSLMGLSLAVLALALYVTGDAGGLIKKRSLITLGVGLWTAMALAPRLKRQSQIWSVVGLGALWLIARGLLGVLPWAAPPGLDAVLAAGMLRGLRYGVPRAWPVGAAKVAAVEWGYAFLGLLLCVASPPTTLLSGLPLLGVLALTLTRRTLVSDALTVAALGIAVAGPLLAPWAALSWAPVAVFALAIVGLSLRRFAWMPRGFVGLALVMSIIWIAGHGLDLGAAVLGARAQVGGLSVGVGWIALAATAVAYFGRKTPLRWVLATPLLWWAPIATQFGHGPVRAAPSIAVLAMLVCVLRRQRPQYLWLHLALAAGLAADLWPHLLVPVTAGGIAAAMGLAAWRYRDARDVQLTPWVIAGAGALMALSGTGNGPPPWHWIGAALAAAAWLAAATRCIGATVGVLSGLALAAIAYHMRVDHIDVWSLGVALAVAAAPWILWWRTRVSSALGGAMYALVAALPFVIAFAHGTSLTTAVWYDTLVGVAAVAVCAAGLRRSTPTVLIISGLALLMSIAGTQNPRALIAALLVGSALVLHGRRHAWALELAFAPFAYAAALAVGLAFDAPLDARHIEPWIAAAIAGIALIAALAQRRLGTLLVLIAASAWVGDGSTTELGVACGAILSTLALGARAIRTRLGRDAAWAIGSLPLVATCITGWAMHLNPHWPLFAYTAGYCLLTIAWLIRVPQKTWRVFTAAMLFGGAMVLLAGLASAALPMQWGGLMVVAGATATFLMSRPIVLHIPRTIHALIGLGMLLHWALAQATPWLGGLAGHHVELWVSLCAVAAATLQHLPPHLQKALPLYLFGLPCLALLTAQDAGGIARAAFLGALTFGLAGRQGKRWVRYAAFALANIGAWAFCFDMGLVDPTLYGLPPGLTLLVLAEVERDRLSSTAHLGLLATGFALAYGGIAVQIITVGGALHAVLLLVGGLISVGFGWATRRADLLIGGTAAVILDVICYLVRNGFQQSFVSAGLLLFAGATVLLAATVAARMRRTAA